MPRNSVAPTTGQDALYSGLLECPLTTRITKDIDSSCKSIKLMYYRVPNMLGSILTDCCMVVADDVLGAGSCPHEIMTAAECFSAVTKALPLLAKGATHQITDSPTLPSGCTVGPGRASGRSQLAIVFNTAKRAGVAVGCGANATQHTGATQSLVHVSLSLDLAARTAEITLTGPSSVWFGVGFGQSDMKGTYSVIVDGTYSGQYLSHPNSSIYC